MKIVILTIALTCPAQVDRLQAGDHTRTVPWDIGAYAYIPPASGLLGTATLINATLK